MSKAASLIFHRINATPLRDLARGRLTARLDWSAHVATAGLPRSVADAVARVVRRSALGRVRRAALASSLIADALAHPASAEDALKNLATAIPLARLARHTRGSLWPAKVATTVPNDVVQLAMRVVARTGLWPGERAAVADELLAHFADAIAAGVSPAQSIGDFGDERATAKLIRRAKRRQRPLVWHAWTWTWKAAPVVLAAYGLLLLPYALGRPSPRVDYVAELSTLARAAPTQQRAWPLWREFIIACTTPSPCGRSLPISMASNLDSPPDRRAQAQWLSAHTDAMALARRAAARPILGFILGPGGSEDDPALFPGPPGHWDQSSDEPLVCVVRPHLPWLQDIAGLLKADLRAAADANDGDRVEADAVALHRLAEQIRSSDWMLVTQMVALGVDRQAVESLAGIAARPGMLSDAALIRLAQTFSGPRVAADLIDLRGERAYFADALQRMYTDDGRGDGHFTWTGIWLQPLYAADHGFDPLSNPMDRAQALPFAVASRARVAAMYAAFMDRVGANLALPRRLADWASLEGQLRAWRVSAVDRVRFAPLLPFLYITSQPQSSAERYLGERDGLLVGLALELYHRRHGRYPAALAELVPNFLPAVPIDRFTGNPLRYRLDDGGPVVYSVGADRTDNGGRLPIASGKDWIYPAEGGCLPASLAAADWSVAPKAAPRGDWILYPPPHNSSVADP